MNIFQLILFISILLIANAQWYIKKNYRTKPMSYPNPGKRSLPELSSLFSETDCSIPYSHLHSDQQKVAWIFKCNYKTSLLTINEDSLPSNSNHFKVEVPPTSKRTLQEKRSLHVVPPYFQDFDNSFNQFTMKLLRRFIK